MNLGDRCTSHVRKFHGWSRSPPHPSLFGRADRLIATAPLGRAGTVLRRSNARYHLHLRIHDLCVGTILVRVVNRFEPNPRLAAVLQFLILAVGAAAIASRLMDGAPMS